MNVGTNVVTLCPIENMETKTESAAAANFALFCFACIAANNIATLTYSCALLCAYMCAYR